MLIVIRIIVKVCVLALLAALTAACNEVSQPTQTVASINGEYLTKLQYSELIKRIPAQQFSLASQQQVAQKMIAQTLAIQAAQKLSLDRKPSVLAKLAAAEKEIIAGAYAEHIAQSVAVPSQSDINAYFNQYPTLFSQRKIYLLNELSLPLEVRENADFVAQLKADISYAKLLQWLEQNTYSYTTSTLIKAAENLPIQIIPKLVSLPVDKLAIFEVSEGVRIYQVIQSVHAPLSLSEAVPRIRQHLIKKRTKELLDNELAQLQQSADIALYGDFKQLLSTD